jgi:hypothetical protein
VNKTGDAADFQIYVYGTRNEAANADFRCNSVNYKADVVLCNSGGKAQATIYAPESQVVFDNSVDLTGAVVSETLLLRNSVKFDWPDSVKEIPGFGPRQHEQKAWVECKAKPTNAADPESGC